MRTWNHAHITEHEPRFLCVSPRVELSLYQAQALAWIMEGVAKIRPEQVRAFMPAPASQGDNRDGVFNVAALFQEELEARIMEAEGWPGLAPDTGARPNRELQDVAKLHMEVLAKLETLRGTVAAMDQRADRILERNQATLERVQGLEDRQAHRLERAKTIVGRAREELEVIRDSFWSEGEPYEERVAGLQSMAGEALRQLEQFANQEPAL